MKRINVEAKTWHLILKICYNFSKMILTIIQWAKSSKVLSQGIINLHTTFVYC